MKYAHISGSHIEDDSGFVGFASPFENKKKTMNNPIQTEIDKVREEAWNEGYKQGFYQAWQIARPGKKTEYDEDYKPLEDLADSLGKEL